MRLVWPLIARSMNRHASPVRSIARARLDPLSNFVADLSWGPGLWKEVENLKSLFAKNVSPVCAKRVGAHERRHRGRGRTARKWGVSEELVAHSLIEAVGLSEGFWVGGAPAKFRPAACTPLYHSEPPYSTAVPCVGSASSPAPRRATS